MTKLIHPVHTELVQTAAARYRNDLARNLEARRFSSVVSAGIEKLLALLINEWTLGFGRDDAPIVAMGS